jgi:hypothetical protein
VPEPGGFRAALLKVAPWAALATVGLLAGLLLRVHQVALLTHLYIAVLGLLACIALIQALPAGSRTAGPGSRVRLRWRRRRPPEFRLRSLQELEHAADFSLTTAFDVHYRLRPHLRRVAEHRLANRGVRLDGDPERARALLGAGAWDLVRPDREAPEDRSAPGITLVELRALVDALEAV